MNRFDNPNYDHYAGCTCPACRPDLHQKKVEGKKEKKEKNAIGNYKSKP